MKLLTRILSKAKAFSRLLKATDGYSLPPEERGQERSAGLPRSEENHRVLLDNIQTQVWYLINDHTYGTVNKAHAEFNGVRMEDLAFKNLCEIFPKAIADIYRQGNIEVFQSGKCIFSEEWIPNASGQERLISIVKTPKLDSNGKVDYVVCSADDITERKQAENQLRESEAYLRSLTKTLPDFIFVLDGEGRIKTVNRLYYGYSEEEVIGQKISMMVPPKYRNVFEETLRQALNTRKLQTVETGIDLHDGKHYFLNRLTPVILDNDEISVVLVATDITNRIKNEGKIKSSEAQLQNILMSLQTGVFIIEEKTHNILFANPAAAALTLSPPDTMIGRQCHKFITPHGERQCSNPDLGKALDNTERVLIRADHTRIPILKSVKRVTYHERPCFLETIIDITQIKKAEKALKDSMIKAELANAAKSEFLANMSHEIRTPLNGVLGMINILLDTDLTEKQLESARIAKASANQLLTLINDILDYSKIEAGKLEFETIRFDLGIVIDNLIEIEEHQFREKKLEFVYDIDFEIPVRLIGDPGRLKQIIINLISNAIKFTPRGKISLRVFLEEDRTSDVMLRFEVNDTGIGIAPEKQKYLFEAFTQADGSTTREYGGTGLGLTICKQLSEMMGGQIGVYSKENEGSSFYFTCVFEKQLPEAGIERGGLPFLDGIRVLIIDHNATSVDIITRCLQHWGADCSHLNFGERGLSLLHSAVDNDNPFHIALIDRNAPETGWISLARSILESPQLAQTKLVLLSSFGQSVDESSALNSGFSACLPKPFKQSQLRDCLGKLTGAIDPDWEPPIPEDLITQDSLGIEKQQKTGQKHTGYHLLLAEDNIVNQQVACDVLEKMGYTVDVANDGQECLTMLEQKVYDLVLMDCQMPLMDGYQATAAIRKSQSGSFDSDIPIIAMTAHTMKGDREKCLKVGMDDYISKPIITDHLAEILLKWLENSSDHEQRRAESREPAPTPKTVTLANGPVFDKEALMNRIMNNEETARAIITAFLDDTPKQIDLLAQYAETGEFENARRQAHTIKGTAGNIGAIELQAISLELEKSEDNKSFMKSIPLLKEKYKKLEVILIKEIGHA